MKGSKKGFFPYFKRIKVHQLKALCRCVCVSVRMCVCVWCETKVIKSKKMKYFKFYNLLFKVVRFLSEA